MIYAVVGLAVAYLGAMGAVLVWLRGEVNRNRDHMDRRDADRKLIAEYRHKYETEVVTHGVCIKQREHEHNLRLIAETQRTEAQARCRTYLARSLEGATKDDINAVLADLFASPLSLVPQPQARRSDGDGPDSLLRPSFDVQPPTVP